MARIIGDKRLNERLTRLAQGADVTPALLKAAARTQQKYVEAINTITGSRKEKRYEGLPKGRVVTVSDPGQAPNTDQSNLVNSTGINSERRNQAEAFASASYAEDLEFGTHKMAPRPAMQPAFDETKQQALADIAAALRSNLRNG